MNIKLTHPDKIIYAEDNISKQQLYDYYVACQSFILPYIINRPITLLRCPANYTECFYQKHPLDRKDLPTIRINEKYKSNDYIYIKDSSGLLLLPQLGVLEIHPWGSKIDALEKPDILIFDIDPGPDIDWKKVVDAAFAFKTELSSLKLKSFVKTTGGKGLHVVVPMIPKFSWDQIKEFSKSLCEYIAINSPKQYTINMKKTERKGKIYLDYLRNQKGATAIAPYSTRARLHAPIATPIDWNELTHNIKDTQFTLKTISERIQNSRVNPWKDFFKIKQSIPLDKLD